MNPAAPPAVSVGIDLVAVPEVRASLAEFGDRYVRRLFTDEEAAYCRAGGDAAPERFAARFAAKEAARKALAVPEDGGGFLWRDVEVVRAPGGAPSLALHGAARAHAARAGITSLAVSLSHEGELATAVVVALAFPSPHRALHREDSPHD